MMNLTMQCLRQFFQHKNLHGGGKKQASEPPSKPFFQKKAEKWKGFGENTKWPFPENGLGKSKYGALAKLASQMSIGDSCICPNAQKAQSLRMQINFAHGKKACKTRTMPDGTVKVWRVK